MEEIEEKYPLRPYQFEVAHAIIDSYYAGSGHTFSVEIARQGGKNEISAQLERYLLAANCHTPSNLIKCSPTFLPQAVISMMRLKDRLNDSLLRDYWRSELGYVIRLIEARAIFLSADESSNVVGNTAHILLEIDEAQDVSKQKYTREFKPMAATTNASTVLYGTTWDDATLLEEVKQANLELERKDGIRRHFRYDWEEVAKYNPAYEAYVLGERERLGENHPLFLTQYRLLSLTGGGGFFNAQQRAQLQGGHNRRHQPEPGRVYVAGIDLAGEEEMDDAFLLTLNPKRDATVVTIAEFELAAANGVVKEPHIRVVEHFAWTGCKHTALYARLVDILKNVWKCRRIVVDATGVGEPVASFLGKALGSRVVPFHFTAQSKSELGFNLLAAVNSGRLKVYRGDGSPEYIEFWQEMERARSAYRASRTMNFYVDPSKGHDDYLMSLALAVEASNAYKPREARGN